ncbi:MAG TPA: aromatic ring-hydroxylating dioxygenase subunit alpha, partial [Rhizomicrobium sp.]
MSNEIKREPETLPARMYYEDAYWELDRTRIWSRAWVLAGLVSDFAKTGDYVSTTVAGYPVMVVKGEDGAIRAFHNVCRHRASPLVREPQGHIDKLLCPYHSWRYAFDGKLLNAPSMRCEKSEFSLFPVRCESWRGLVFVCLSKDVPPVAEWLKDLAGSALRYPLEKMKLARKFTVSGDVNWKTYGDNYAEAWHVPTIHPGLNASIDMAGYKIEAVGDSLQIH